MDKKVIAIIVAIVVVAAGLFMFMGDDDEGDDANNPSTDTSQTESEESTETENIEAAPEGEDQGELIEVSYTDDGFEPDDITVAVGQKVTFVNNSSMSMWVASDDHPTHEDHPDFDNNQGVGRGETYEFTFDEAGEYGYHNHLSSGDDGTVTVVED